MTKIPCDRTALRKFGITMGIAFGLIALLAMRKHAHASQYFAGVSLLFFFCAGCIPGQLRLAHTLWMRLAFVLAWVNTRLLLAIIFYALITPIGCIMRLLGKDPLDRRIQKAAGTYWHKKEKGTHDYTRQF